MRSLSVLLALSWLAACAFAPPAPRTAAPEAPDVPVAVDLGASALEVRLADEVAWYRRSACKKEGVRGDLGKGTAPFLVGVALRSSSRPVDLVVRPEAPPALVEYVSKALEAQGRLGARTEGPALGEVACPPPHLAATRTSTAPKTGRRLEKDDVGAGVRARLPQVKACYERALKEDGRLAGRVAVQFAIGVDGRVGGAVAIEDSVRADVAACTVEQVSRMRFPASDRWLVVTYPFEFAAKDKRR